MDPTIPVTRVAQTCPTPSPPYFSKAFERQKAEPAKQEAGGTSGAGGEGIAELSLSPPPRPHQEGEKGRARVCGEKCRVPS